ncbi:hypothetical protein C8Q72DRAFT_887711 [Fomitopsis betulina]|nr:hypothetical protein C8Q72DRAFT_887706 [Fomitopsis betulina]KAI0726398.1 hypothetical protein C8Q72DRAFT_887711 [Fomitopsis betulina]
MDSLRGPSADDWSARHIVGGHEASQFVEYGWDGVATAMPRHRWPKRPRCAHTKSSFINSLGTSSPRDSESSPRFEVACRTLAVACIAGDGACKIAAWQSTLCADPRDVEMMCAGTSKSPVYARLLGLPLSTSVGPYRDEGRRCLRYSAAPLTSAKKIMPLSNLKTIMIAASPRNVKTRAAPRQWKREMPNFKTFN